MEYQLTHESLSAEREKMIRDKKERAEKHDRPAAMRLSQVGHLLPLQAWHRPAGGSSQQGHWVHSDDRRATNPQLVWRCHGRQAYIAVWTLELEATCSGAQCC